MRGFQAGIKRLWEWSVPHITDGIAPAAGASYALNLDGRYWWRLETLTFTLTTDANAANRYVSVQVPLADSVPLVLGAAAVVVTANTTAQRFSGSVDRGTSEWNTGTDVLFPLQDYPLMGGRSLTINVANVQAGDTLTKIKLAWWRLPTNESIVEQFVGDDGG